VYLLGIPVIASVSSPAQIALLDAADLAVADDGAVSIDRSENAAIEMSYTPIQGETSPITGATVKSLWQNNLVGIRVIRTMNWALAHSTSSVVMSVSY
jgi:hypothetical protein